MMMPRPLSGCQIKAEIQGFLLMYRLFQYQQWFFQDIERRWIPEMTSAPCKQIVFIISFSSFCAALIMLSIVKRWHHFKTMNYIPLLLLV